ncbi:hypothetical protein K458DRAFT_400238 [Lentithecium fluviatile CBS 122367]|uniref:Uncharacterized protein n=1 Tax=Lentithecium fluviatile CBS 122367 TaxID=1168545 RepID=A0A6G1JH42_9PLEO|nr:hypothetical protein K458DRAFT_400238 [Lentithecium fluviatile CBS 122367]
MIENGRVVLVRCCESELFLGVKPRVGGRRSYASHFHRLNPNVRTNTNPGRVNFPITQHEGLRGTTVGPCRDRNVPLDRWALPRRALLRTGTAVIEAVKGQASTNTVLLYFQAESLNEGQRQGIPSRSTLYLLTRSSDLPQCQIALGALGVPIQDAGTGYHRPQDVKTGGTLGRPMTWPTASRRATNGF